MSTPLNTNTALSSPTVTTDQDQDGFERLVDSLQNPTEYSEASKKMSFGGERIRTAKFPLNGGNNHFIRFFINLNEESKLINLFKVRVDKDAELSGQNRSQQNTTSQNAVDVSTSLGAGALGATMGAAVAGKASAIGLKSIFNKKIGAGAAAVATGTGLVAGGAAGASAGGTIGELVSDYLKVTNRLKRLVANITLYTPANIVANYRLNYDMPEDLLVVLAQSENYEALKAGLAAVGSPLADVGLDGGSLLDAKAWGQTGDALGKFGRIIATGASKTVNMLSRTAINKRKDIMFTHVGNRTFRFNYTFAPKSVAEAKEVDDIIFMFKYFAHPEMLPGYGNFLYLYPAEFDIEYGLIQENSNTGTPAQTQNKYLNKISSCVLVDISVNYAPADSFQSLEQGEPLITTLSMEFMEIEQLHRDRIGQGF